jgi:hypothetical protein
MFDFLKDQPSERVLGAAYFAARLLTHRTTIPNYLKASPVKGVRSEPSAEEAELGRQVIGEIVEREATNLETLSRNVASDYLSQLLDLVNSRLADGAGQATSERSRRVLDRWRSATAKWPVESKG